MRQFEEKVEFLLIEAKKLGLYIDESLFYKIAKSLGPALYHPDASLVATSDAKEMSHIRSTFIAKKLEIRDELLIDTIISEVTAQLGFNNRYKHRALFYYLLVEKFGKASFYND